VEVGCKESEGREERVFMLKVELEEVFEYDLGRGIVGIYRQGTRWTQFGDRASCSNEGILLLFVTFVERMDWGC